MKSKMLLVELGNAVRHISLCALLGLCVNLMSLSRIIVLLPRVFSTVQHPLCAPQPHKPGAARECELEVYTEGSSSWVYTSGRATHPDKTYNALGSSLKKIWSHITICKHHVCKTGLMWVEKEREICSIPCIQLQRQLGLHPPKAWNPACTSVPAHDATYCACTSVAWHPPYTSGKKGVQSLHSDLEIFSNWNSIPQWQLEQQE